MTLPETELTVTGGLIHIATIGPAGDDWRVVTAVVARGVATTLLTPWRRHCDPYGY